MKNTELARQVVVHVLAYPEQHNQHVWLDETTATYLLQSSMGCPTKACLAGWAIFLDGGATGLQDTVTEAGQLIHSNDYNNFWCKAAGMRLSINTDGPLWWIDNFNKLQHIFLEVSDKQEAIEKFIALFGLDAEDCQLAAKKLREETTA